MPRMSQQHQREKVSEVVENKEYVTVETQIYYGLLSIIYLFNYI